MKPGVPMAPDEVRRVLNNVEADQEYGKRVFIVVNGYHTPISKVYLDSEGDLIIEGEPTR
jgi:hypothetical protein